MGFQPRARTPRDFGRRPGKNKHQTKPGKHRTGSEYRFEEEHVATPAEVASRTLNSLSRLGDQRFAVAPFYDHYDRWLLNLRNVISDFENSSTITVDDRFKEERSRTLSNIELTLKSGRAKETSNDDSARKLNRSLLDAKSLLAKTDREHAARKNEIASKRENAVKPVVTNLGRLRAELNRIVHMRAGFLRGISKKAKADKASEAAQKLDSTKKELAKIEQSFAHEEEELNSEYEQRRQQILERIKKHQGEIADIDAGMQTDDSLDARRATCDELVNSVNSLLQRTQSSSEAETKS
jgi:uncharacterized damage-inducible protein DinB